MHRSVGRQQKMYTVYSIMKSAIYDKTVSATKFVYQHFRVRKFSQNGVGHKCVGLDRTRILFHRGPHL